MDELLNELDILLERFRFHLKRSYKGVLEPVRIKPFNDFIIKWKEETGKLNNIERKKFLHDNRLRFYQIYDTFVGHFAKPILSTDDLNKTRSINDTIFNSLNIIRPATVFNHLPTQLFTEFCKGITYFKNQTVEERPVYHRKDSCGTGKKTISDKFKEQYSIDKLVSKKEHMRNCYIERLMYSNIYLYTLHAQDIAHNDELQLMERLYDQVYNDFINIKIVYEKRTPVEINILTNSKINYNDFYQIVEQYIKEPNSNIVKCNKTVTHGDLPIKKYYKIQTFDKEEEWIEGGNGIRYPTIKEKLLKPFTY